MASPFLAPVRNVPDALSSATASLRERVRTLKASLAASTPAHLGQLATASELSAPRMPEMRASGIQALDTLCGGLACGALTEISGEASTGRTSLALAAMATTTRAGEVCALIDPSDAFNPADAQQAGVHLRQLLWIRCNGKLPAKRDTAPRYVENEFGGFDYVPLKAGDSARSSRKARLAPLYARLEQSLRVMDLLLQAGGFGLVVLDMADLPPEVARRVPMTTWFRLRRAVENTPTSLLILQQEPYAQTCAFASARLIRHSAERTTATPAAVSPTHARLLLGMHSELEMVRTSMRSTKKPVSSVRTASHDVTPRAWWAATSQLRSRKLS